MARDKIASIKNVHFAYQNKPALQNVSLDIHKGDFIGLIGPNGGGKTTLIKLLLHLLRADKGTISLFNSDISSVKDWNKISFVSQKANAFNRGFPATVYEVVSMGLTAQVGYFRRFKTKHKQAVKAALEQVGMLDYLHENISNLSGGQQQRVFIARALVSSPELLILDEPTVGIDQANVKSFYELLRDLNQKQGITMLMVSHDVQGLLAHATKLIYLNQEIKYEGKPEDFSLSNDPLQLMEVGGIQK